MKITSLNINTRYPSGYSATDPRFLEGSITVQTGESSWNNVDHQLTPDALEQIAKIALADYTAQPAKLDTFESVGFFPPVIEEPTADPTAGTE